MISKAKRKGRCNWVCCLLTVWLAYPGVTFSQDTQRPANPREMLAVMQIDDSLLRQFVDGRPVGEQETESLLRILFRLPGFAQVDIDRWTKPLGDTKSLLDACAQNRFELFELRGQVQSIQTRTVLPELVDRLGFAEYYRVLLKCDQFQSVVYLRELPQTWRGPYSQGESIRQQVSVQALLLKRQDIQGAPALVFAATRLSWYPDSASAMLGVTESQVLLGRMGVDCSQFANLQHRATMRSEDRESFYQMLAAVRHAETTQFEKLASRSFDISRLIRQPSQVVGELYALQGTARRAIRIEVGDRDIRERFGIDHYFEVEVFLPLPKPVRFVDERHSEGKVFQDYPFVICVPDLPPQMPTGDDIRVPVRFAGFFLKLWAYRTQFMADMQTRDSKPAKQLSPLLIGPSVLPIETVPPANSPLSLIIAGLFIASLLLLWALMGRASYLDRRRSQQLFQKNLPVDSTFSDLRSSEKTER